MMAKQIKEHNYEVFWSEYGVVNFLNDMQDEIHIVNIIKDSAHCSKYIVFYYKKVYK